MEQEVNLREQPRWARSFFTVWVGQAFSMLGSMLVQFALIWWLTQTTGSATVLATATLVAVLPQIFVGPFAGALVDRWNRRAVMIVADTLIAVTTLGLVYLNWIGAMQVWHVYVAMALRAIGGGFHFPAWQASISLMVPEKHLARIAGVNQTLNGVINIIGPGLGALLLSLLPMAGVLSVDIATAAIAVSMLLLVKIPQPAGQERAEGSGAASMLIDLREGWRYVWNWPGLLAIMVVAMLINFVINPAFALLPLLVTGHFGGGVPELAGLESAWGIGVIAGGVALSAWGGFRRRIVTSMLGVVVMGLGSAGVGLLPPTAYALAVFSMLLMGFTNPMINGPIFAIMQSRVDPQMQGRVVSLVTSAATAMMPLSLAIAGPLSDAIGVRAWYIIGGLLCAVIGAVSFLLPAVMHMEDVEKTGVAGVDSQPLPAVGVE